MTTRRFIYNYAQIDSEGMCIGTVSTPRAFDRPDFVEIPECISDYIGKYYIDGTWYERVYNSYDENGNPIIDAGYTDVPWSPEV